jgi:hypothetical protein
MAVTVGNGFNRWHILRLPEPHYHASHPAASAPLPLRGGRQPDSTFALNCCHSASDTNTRLPSLRHEQCHRTHSQTFQ